MNKLIGVWPFQSPFHTFCRSSFTWLLAQSWYIALINLVSILNLPQKFVKITLSSRVLCHHIWKRSPGRKLLWKEASLLQFGSKMSSKRVKHVIPVLWCYCALVEPLKDGISITKLVHVKYLIEGVWETSTLYLSFLLTSIWEVSRLTLQMLSAVLFCLITGSMHWSHIFMGQNFHNPKKN